METKQTKKTNSEIINEKLDDLTPDQRDNFMFFMFGVLTKKIDALPSDCAEMRVLIRQLDARSVI